MQSLTKSLTIVFSILLVALTSNAQVLGTMTTTIEGGVKGNETEFTPLIELYALDKSKRDINTRIFEANTIQNTNEISFTIASNNDDSEFETFINTLTTSSEHLLRVGHTIKGIKSQSASSIQGWFGDDVDFLGQNITHITITYKNVKLDNQENWTTFSYDLEVKVFGSQAVAVEVSDK